MSNPENCSAQMPRNGLTDLRYATLLHSESFNQIIQAGLLNLHPQMSKAVHKIDAFLFKKYARHMSTAAINWLAANADEFRVAPIGEESLAWQVKRLIELMTILTTLASHGVCDRGLSKLNQTALAYGEAFDWHEMAAYDASAATVIGIVADFFQSNGLQPPFEMDFVLALHEMGFFEGMDRIPFREMDLAYTLGLMVSPEFHKDMPTWFSSTTFGHGQNITRYSIDDLYSVTHAVFYLTGFGRQPLTGLLDDQTVARLKRELVAFTVVLLRADNIDVLGELLLCWLFCAIENTALHRMIFQQAFKRISLAACPDGQVAPTLKHLPRVLAGQTSFGDVYHTTLVCGMLFALAAEETPYVQ